MVASPEKNGLSNWSGSHFWRLVVKQDRTFCLEPLNLRYLALFAASSILAILIFIGLATPMPMNPKIGITAMGGFAGCLLVAGLWMHNRYQLRLGPYLRYDGQRFYFRDGFQIDKDEFQSFEIERRWEKADEVIQVSYLTIHCKSRPPFEVVASVYHRQIVKLKTQLEQAMQ